VLIRGISTGNFSLFNFLRSYFLSDFEEGSVSDLGILRNLRTHKLYAQSELETARLSLHGSRRV
jgi:hypothetical protein